MSPTTREVEAARVERMRRAAAQRAAAEAEAPAPRTRAERLEAEARAATGPRWACRLDGCPIAHTWHPAPTVSLVEALAEDAATEDHLNAASAYLDRNGTALVARTVALPPCQDVSAAHA